MQTIGRRQFLVSAGMGGLAAAGMAAKVRAASAPPAQRALTLGGSPRDIGISYGKQFAEAIRRNLRILLGARVPAEDPLFREWVQSQEKLVEKHWPWYVEEMHGVAEGIDGRYEDVLLLNVRAWQYAIYGAPPAQACSSLAVRLADGHMACAGALDDPIELYCGPVHFAGRDGYRLITFPITGTSWGNRGMNSAGLSVGISSQLLPGLKRLGHAVVQDIAMRAMLQTCATVNEVREFCRCHPFTMNLICVDAAGDLFCAQHTAAGLREIKVDDACALTNHLVEEETESWLRQRGVREFPRSATTVPRRNKLLRFLESASGKCTAEEVKALIARREDSDPASIHNSGSIYLTYSCPQVQKTTFWILQPNGGGSADQFQPFAV